MIESIIPGGWYLVSNLFQDDPLDVVISSQNLELVPHKLSFTETLVDESQQDLRKLR